MFNCFCYSKEKKNSKQINNVEDQEELKLAIIKKENYTYQMDVYKQILSIYKEILNETNIDKIINNLKIENNILKTTNDSIISKLKLNEVKVIIL